MEIEFFCKIEHLVMLLSMPGENYINVQHNLAHSPDEPDRFDMFDS